MQPAITSLVEFRLPTAGASTLSFDQEMKNHAYNVLRVIALLGAVLLGSLPFLISFIIGIALGHRWGAYTAALLLTVGITLLSFWHPETFRFVSTDLKIHDGLFVAGFHPLVANLAKNLAFAVFGVRVGRAAREGYQDARSNKPAHPTAGNVPV